MACLVHAKDKRTGIIYVYSSESYWDKEKKAPRNRRTLIGKLDPETGEIIPTGKRGRKPKDAASAPAVENTELARLYEEGQARIKELSLEVNRKDLEIASLTKEIRQLKDMLSKIDKHLAQCRDICATDVSRL